MKRIEADELPFEFMMNALRLNEGVPAYFYEQRTGLSLSEIEPVLNGLRQKNYLSLLLNVLPVRNRDICS